MYTHRDIMFRTIFIINCIVERNLKVQNGELLLEEESKERKRTLTKIPFQKVLALFVVGNITITTPLIEKCQKYGVALIVMKTNLRPVFYWSNFAEANYLLRQKQYRQKDNVSIAKMIVINKIKNQRKLLEKTRKKDNVVTFAKTQCNMALDKLITDVDYDKLLGIENNVAKYFFEAYYQDYQWNTRRPRTKCDILNTTLDLGYTILFNFTECFVRMFGFDLYVGVYHRLWFKRKSLICDLMEPFRCIVDHTILLAFNKKQFSANDFECINGMYYLKFEKKKDYYHIFYDAMIEKKSDFFKYVQSYYRCFMKGSPITSYPEFTI